MRPLHQEFAVTFRYTVHFTSHLFSPENPLLAEVVRHDHNQGSRKILFVLDQVVVDRNPELPSQILTYLH